MIALAAACPVVEGFHCLCQAALIVAAIVNHGGPVVGLVRKISALNEIPSTHLNLIKVEMTCNRVDRPFGDVSPFGAAIPAIGVNWYGIRHDHSGVRLVILDFVGPGPKIDGIHRRTSGCHIRQIGADIAQRLNFQAEYLAVVAYGDFNRLRMRPSMIGGLMAFGTRFPPLDGHAEETRQIRAEQFLRVEVHLGAEPAANVRCHNPQLMFGNTDRVGDPSAMHMGHLALQVNRQGAVGIRLS